MLTQIANTAGTSTESLKLSLINVRGELVSWVFCASTGPLKSGAKPLPETYSSLLSSGCQAGEHAACFAELRRNFINTRPAKLRSLMLLVKHWYRQVSTLTLPLPRSHLTPFPGSHLHHSLHPPKCLGWSAITSFQVVLHRGQLLEPSSFRALL